MTQYRDNWAIAQRRLEQSDRAWDSFNDYKYKNNSYYITSEVYPGWNCSLVPVSSPATPSGRCVISTPNWEWNPTPTLDKLIDNLEDLETDSIIYTEEQLESPTLEQANPYAINRKLGLLSRILRDISKTLDSYEDRIDELEDDY